MNKNQSVAEDKSQSVAETIARIFLEYVNGKCPREIARALNTDGSPQPSDVVRDNPSRVAGPTGIA